MSGLTAVLSLALATHAISVDNYPLRKGCEDGEPIIAQLQKGDPVEIRFRLAGSGGGCYKVSVESRGKSLRGYVSAAAITDTEAFDRGVRDAPGANVPTMLRAAGQSIQKAAYARGAQDPGSRAARLIEQNRPLEALRTLQPVLKTVRNDAGLLSLAGYAAYRGDDMRTAMDYWEQSLALRRSTSVERLYQRAAREVREDNSGQKLVGSRFLLRYNRGQMKPATARQILTMLEREYARVSQKLGCRTEERIVAIVQTPEEYQRTTDAAEWSSGEYNGRIRVAANDQTQFSERTRRTFAHEIVHACLAELGHFPTWLHEGLAQELSGETLSPYQRQLVHRMAASGQLPKLENLSQTWARMSTAHAAVAYSTALAAIELFYKYHRGVGPRNLLRNPQMLAQIQADLDRRLRR